MGVHRSTLVPLVMSRTVNLQLSEPSREFRPLDSRTSWNEILPSSSVTPMPRYVVGLLVASKYIVVEGTRRDEGCVKDHRRKILCTGRERCGGGESRASMFLVAFFYAKSYELTKTQIYKCQNPDCPPPSCFKSYPSSKEAHPKCERPGCDGRMDLQRYVLVVFSPESRSNPNALTLLDTSPLSTVPVTIF